MAHEYFDIIVVIPMEEELLEFLEIFPTLENRSTQIEFRYIVDSGNPLAKVATKCLVSLSRSAVRSFVEQ